MLESPEKFDETELDEGAKQIMDDIHHYPLLNEAERTLKRMFRRKAGPKEILDLAREKYKNESLVNKKESGRMDEPPRIICSMGRVKES